MSTCSGALTILFEYLPYLGFILRSTNVRNAFEMHGPLLRLARKMLGPSTKLILSSEWDYSPYAYLEITSLRDFVLIGLPAPESENPLLLPLAGHELGHAVWNRRVDLEKLKDELSSKLLQELKDNWDKYRTCFPSSVTLPENVVADRQALKTFDQVRLWALDQCKETFCDFIGLGIFGRSYLHAFAYLLSSCQMMRFPQYPSMKRRADDLHDAAKIMGYDVPLDYVQLFQGEAPVVTDAELLPLADAGASGVRDHLIDLALEKLREADVPTECNQRKIEEICARFERFIVPPRDPEDLVSVINAAWIAYEKKDLWEDRPEVHKRKDAVLKDLVLKTVEVLEISHIMAEQE